MRVGILLASIYWTVVLILVVNGFPWYTALIVPLGTLVGVLLVVGMAYEVKEARRHGQD